MAKQIKNSDLVQPKLWQETVDETNALIKVLGELEKSFKKVSATAGKTAKEANPGSAKGIKDINSATELLKKTSIETDKVRAQIATAEAQRTKAAVAASKQRASQEEKAANKRQKAATDLIKQRKAAEAATKKEAAQVIRLTKQKEREAATTARATAKTLEGNRAYNKASRELNILRKRFKDLAISGKGTKTEMAALLFQITKLDKKIKSVDSSVGQSQRNVGNYSSAFKGLGQGIGSVIGPMVGITAAIGAVTAGIRAATGLFREFGLVSAKVQAVSGATATEFESLQTQAKELGRVTPFTASNVAQLQLELSKLGFVANEITASTEAILNFAIATDSELGRSAEVVASTLNAFNLEAGEAGRVADVAAKAFSSSALDIEKFAAAISNVGPASNAVGVSLERTTAILAKIVDSGVDASKAGTDLRNIFIDLETKGLTWNEAIEKIQGSQDKLKVANELFGKRATISANIIANNVVEIDKLDKSFQNASGAAAAAADIIGNTLDGDIKKLTSAFEGLVLGTGKFGKALRVVTKGLTSFVNVISGVVTDENELAKASLETARQLSGEAKEAEKLLKRYEELTEDGIEPSSETKSELATITLRLSELLGDEAVEIDKSTQALRVNIDASKDLLAQKILLINESASQVLQNIENNKVTIAQNSLLAENLKATVRTLQSSKEFRKEFERVTGSTSALDEALESSGNTIEDYQDNIIGISNVSPRAGATLVALGGDTKKLTQALFQLNKLQVTSNVLTRESTEARKELEKFLTPSQISSLLDDQNELNKANEKGSESTEDLTDKTENQVNSIKKLRAQLSGLKRQKNEDIEITDKKSIASKEKEIQVIEKQIKALEELGKSKETPISKQLSDVEEKEQFKLEERKLEIITKANEEAESIKEDSTINANEKAEQLSRAQAEKAEQFRLAEIKNLENLIRERGKILEKDDETQLKLRQELNDAKLNQTTEFINVEADLKNDAAKASAEAAKKESEAKITAKAQEAEATKALQEDIKDGTIAAIDVLDQAFAKSSQNRLDEIDRETAALKTREGELRQAAQNGSELAEENLATNQRLQAEQIRVREEQVKKAQRREIVLAGIKAFAENAGEPGAVQKTLTDITTLSAALLNLPFLFEGTEDTGTANKSIDSNGGRLAVLHDNERVMTKKQNAMMGGLSNDDVASIVHDHVSPTHFDHAPMVQVQRFESNAEVLQKFDVLAEKLDNLPNRMPRIVDEKFDEKSKVYTTVVKTGNKVEKNHKRINGIWG